MPHCTLPYNGTRYTLIYFTQRSFAKVDDDSYSFLVDEMGFPFPEAGVKKRAYPKQLARVAAGLQEFGPWK